MNRSAHVLLVIDMQQGAFDGVRLPPIDRADGLLNHAEQLLAAARGSRTAVVHVQHCDEAGQAFERGTPQWLFHERLTPLLGEAVVQKLASSAFEGTNLQDTLKRLSARTLVVCGLQSEICVSNTAKSALSLSFDVLVAEDAHSTWPSAGRSAKLICDQVNHDLRVLGASPCPTHQLVKRLAGGSA